MDTQTVLVVEDEDAFVEALQLSLPNEGFTVQVARDGAEALQRFDEINPDIVLLDLMLPRISGVDVCREIRTKSKVPIIMVTAKSTEVDTVVGLEVGADDYVTKPYRMKELVARMRALIRRSEFSGDPSGAVDGLDTADDVVVIDGVRVDAGSHEVTVDDESVALTLKEFDLLRFLISNAGRVLTRDMLINRVWGPDYVGETKTLDVHIKRLRSKIEVNPSSPERIVTIRGLGYKYELAKS